ncbi:MAG: MotA/TolQ/ExbB proton channel family protein [Verrucomicrobia bacterium]|nr:MotA/TolQ/ExbB proton channel family protein [Verrucomicrobiota bacterium]
MNMKLRKLLPLFVLGAALVPTFLFAQEAVEPAAEAATEAVSEDSFLDTLAQGGWVMWPLLICSIALVWLTVDGYMRSMIKRMFPPAHIEQIRTLFQNGDYRGAYEFCKANPSTLSDVVRMGVVFLPDGKTMTEEAIFSEISRIKAGFDARISYLSVIGVCAPMVGLLGTVTGMKGAFGALGKEGVGGGGAGELAGHIGEVLVATASGLAVSIPAFFFFYLLRNRITTVLHDLQEVVTGLFRKMPYEKFEGYQIGDEEIYAAMPNWVEAEEAAAPAEEAPQA